MFQCSSYGCMFITFVFRLLNIIILYNSQKLKKPKWGFTEKRRELHSCINLSKYSIVIFSGLLGSNVTPYQWKCCSLDFIILKVEEKHQNGMKYACVYATANHWFAACKFRDWNPLKTSFLMLVSDFWAK